MEFLIGMQCKDFVLVASDTAAARSIVQFKQDQEKTIELGNSTIMSVCGESGDVMQFGQYIQKNLQLYKMRNGYELSPKGMAHYTRRQIADSLRKNPYQVNMLVAGHDKSIDKCELYFLDYFGTCMNLPFCAHGYGSNFILSTMDRHYNEALSIEQAVKLLKRCMGELKKRFIINIPAMNVKIVDRNGINNYCVLGEKDYEQ